MKGLFFILLLLLFHTRAKAQQNDDQLQKILDDWIQTQDEQTDYEGLLEQLYLLAADPIDINKASAEELRSLFLLTEHEIKELIRYREATGNITDVYELQAIENWSVELIEMILPFITIEKVKPEKNLWQRVKSEGKGYLLWRTDTFLEERKGFNIEDVDKQFQGNRFRQLIRIRKSSAGDYSFGLTAEKDAGEKWRWNVQQHQPGFDYYNVHLQVQNKKSIQNFIVGDFQLQSGQGLLHGNAFGLGKGGETINTIRRNNTLFKPFTSTLENGGFRGVASTIKINSKLNLSGYLSYKNRNASSQTDSVGNNTISSWRNSGLHRNENERNGRQQITETAHGGIVQYENNTTLLGIQFQNISFSKAIKPKPNLYNQFAFSGKNFQAASFYFSKTISAFHFFGESALYKKYVGMNIGLLAALSNRTDWLLQYRFYDKQFVSLSGNPFAESSTGQNEIGFYTGLKHQIKKKHIFSAYADFYQFQWLRFRLYQPNTGWDALLRYQYMLNKKTNFIFQYRTEEKPRNSSQANIAYQINIITKQQIMMSMQHQASDSWKFQTRIQFAQVNNPDRKKGIALAQDVSYKHKFFTMHYRYCIFDVSDFDARHYIVERDVWSSASLPVLNGQGSRSYLLLQFKFNKALSLWFRYAHTYLKNIDEMGSGLDATTGNTRNEIKFQVMVNF
ncbi:MAG: helix-hairpin-helix domain-containing protein [Flammeovirgaceae bacterium]|nr:helix-hairpin-helix domain-containing protein [Flammeovirgaceae bacterium]